MNKIIKNKRVSIHVEGRKNKKRKHMRGAIKDQTINVKSKDNVSLVVV